MRILDIVSSNIVQDPRVLKQIETIKSITDDYKIVGMNNSKATEERKRSTNFNFLLLGSKKDTSSIFGKLVKRIKFAKGVIKEIKDYQPDVIHANDFDVLFMVYLSGYKKANIIFDAHEIYAKNAFINKFAPISKIVETLEKHIIKTRATSFVTVSHAAKKYYADKGYKKSAYVVTNAPISTIERKYSEKTSVNEIVYQGQIVADRGYEEFVKASMEFKKNDPLFIVRGFGPLEESLREFVTANEANVKLDKPVEVKELVEKLTESDIGVVLTKPISINFEYTISNKIFENLHAGLPVILSPVKEHYYLNDKYDFGIVIDEVTPKDIADAVRKLKMNPELYNRLRHNAIEAAKILNWENESKKLKELYLQ